MKLTWDKGQGPPTTQALADLVAAEGRWGTRTAVDEDNLRCLWGVIDDARRTKIAYDWLRQLSISDVNVLREAGCSAVANDYFAGTPEERCAEMTRRLRTIP